MRPNYFELTGPDKKVIRGIHQDPFCPGSDPLHPVIMIFCHGFPNSHMGAYGNLFQKLQNICAQLGIPSIRFDFRGCGSSDGSSENFTIHSAMQDLDTVMEWLDGHGFSRIMLTAEGLGVVPALISLGELAEAGAFFWLIFQTQDFAVSQMDAEQHRENFEKGGYFETPQGKIGIPLVKELYEMDLVPVMNQVKFPCLIQQGVQDDIVPVEYLDMACAHFRNRRIELTTYQDGTHGLPQENHRKYMMFHYEQFIQKYI